jgi:hypothetical protein
LDVVLVKFFVVEQRLPTDGTFAVLVFGYLLPTGGEVRDLFFMSLLPVGPERWVIR